MNIEKNKIRIVNLNKTIGKTKILKNISLNIETGKIYGIIGRNGSGKTVLMKCICGLMPITSGEIYVDDKSIGKDIDMPQNIGIIIETPGFLPNYSGFQNLLFISKIKNCIDRQTIKDTIKLVGLNPDDKKYVGKYSLGMRQRLGIAQAIMENPDILILDEPMNGLDNTGVDDIRKLLLSEKEKGKTIILASHNREDISILCDKVYEMDNGVITENK